MEHGSRTRLLSAVVVAVVFAAGVLVGFAADSSLNAQAAAPETESTAVVETPESEAEAEQLRGTRFTRPLNPTPAQFDAIDAIIAVHRERTNALDEEIKALFRERFREEILLQTRAEIKALFSAEKAAEYQRLLDEWDARQAAERENGDSRK